MVVAEDMPGSPGSAADAGSGRVVLLVVVAALAAFFLIPPLVDPEFGTEEPPWGDRETVVVEPSGDAGSEPAEGTGGAAEGTAEIDRTAPAEVLRDAVTDSVRFGTPFVVGVTPTGAQCDDVEFGAGRREASVTCFAEYEGVRMRYEVAVTDLQIPVGAGRMTWYEAVAPRTVIVTQDNLNDAFLTHLGETGRRDEEEQQVRCDRVPEPVVVAVDELHRHRCYRWPPGVGASRVYFLTLSGRLSFEPWSGLHPREADSWQPEG